MSFTIAIIVWFHDFFVLTLDKPITYFFLWRFVFNSWNFYIFQQCKTCNAAILCHILMSRISSRPVAMRFDRGQQQFRLYRRPHVTQWRNCCGDVIGQSVDTMVTHQWRHDIDTTYWRHSCFGHFVVVRCSLVASRIVISCHYLHATDGFFIP